MNRAEWKATAKMRMAQSDPSYLKVMLLWILAAVIVPNVAMNAVSSTVSFDLNQFYALVQGGFDPEMALQALRIPSSWMAANGILSLVLSIYQGVLGFGLTAYSLRLYRGEECGPGDLFCGFSMAGRVIGAQLLVGLFIILWCILVALATSIVMTFTVLQFFPIEEQFTEVEAIVFAILLIALMFGMMLPFLLRYVLVSLALADRPELGALGAIQYSKNLMRGHKWEYIVLGLTFLGWSLLCQIPRYIYGFLVWTGILFMPSVWLDTLISIVLLIPVYLWLTPYVQATFVGFYESLNSQGFVPFQPGPQA